jgi:hypothetical protein
MKQHGDYFGSMVEQYDTLLGCSRCTPHCSGTCSFDTFSPVIVVDNVSSMLGSYTHLRVHMCVVSQVSTAYLLCTCNMLGSYTHLRAHMCVVSQVMGI